MSQALTANKSPKLMIAKTITEDYIPLRTCKPGAHRYRPWAYGMQTDSDGRTILLLECTRCDRFKVVEKLAPETEVVAP